MKTQMAIFGLALVSAVLFTGCVPMTYSRSITVHKDASGNITGTDEYEGFTEAHSEGQKITEVSVGKNSFKYLK